MSKRMLALVLAIIFVMSTLALAACKDGSKPDPADQGNNASTGDKTTEGKDEGTEPPKKEDNKPETNADGLLTEFFEGYAPDADAKYSGKVGIGGTKVSFDKVRAVIKNKEAVSNDWESGEALNANIFSTLGGKLEDWKVADDTVGSKGKVISYTGSESSILTFGNDKWTAYNFIVPVALEDGGTAEMYICVKDDKNYIKVTAGSTADVGVTAVEVKDGKETKIGTFPMAIEPGSWVNMSATISKSSISIFVAGTELFRIGESAGTHTYSGLFGICQWNTEFYVDNIKIEDGNGKVLYEEDFEDGTFLDNAKYGLRNGGSWSIANTSDWEIAEVDGNKVLHYKNSGVYGSVVLFDPKIPADAKNIKFSYEGYRVGGSEGYACVWDWNESTMVESTGEGKDYTCLNIGGWSGQCGFQFLTGGSKVNEQNNAPIGLESAKWQKVELYLNPENMFAIFDGNFVQVHWY